MKAMLAEWGLESLASTVYDFLIQGYSQENIGLLLRDTETYKQRFSGNELRRQAGLRVLSPQEYLETERSYRQIMYNAGLPEGFYDGPEDYARWIGHDVAPTEVQRRVDEAVDSTYRADDNTKAVWASMGLNPDDMVAWVLDQDRGRNELDRIIRGGRIGGAARGYGVDLQREQMERFGLMATNDYVREAMQFGQLAGTGQRLSNIYAGEDYGAEAAAAEVFQSSTDAERKRKQLYGREEAEFAGAGGSGRSGLSQGTGNY